MQKISQIIPLLAPKAPPVSISGLKPSAAAFLAAQANARIKQPILLVTASEAQASQLAQDLALFTTAPVHYYPGYEIPAYTPLSPDPQTTAQRLSTLYKIKTTGAAFIMVASCEALLRKILPDTKLTGLAELLISGEEVDQDDLARRLIDAGYEAMSLVQNAGEFSRRGGIMDIFPPGFDYPIRLDFFGDLVETMRLFDPISQRSIQEIKEAEIIPVSDILYPTDEAGKSGIIERVERIAQELSWSRDEKEVVCDKISRGLKFAGIEFFLPLFHNELSDPIASLVPESLIFLLDPHQIARTLQLVWERIEANYQEACAVQSAIMPPETIYLTEAAFQKRINQFKTIKLFDFEEIEPFDAQPFDSAQGTISRSLPLPQEGTNSAEGRSLSRAEDRSLSRSEGRSLSGAEGSIAIQCGNHTLIKQHLELQRQKFGLLPPLTVYLRDWLKNGDQVHIACRSERHAAQLGQMLTGHDLPINLVDGPALRLTANQAINLYPLPLSAGFDLLDEQIHFLSEIELFGEKRLSQSKKKKAKTSTEPAVNFEELKIGDIVVHRDHGLAIYDGISTIRLGELANDFLLLTYKDEDKLYVPVDRINTISKYNGLTDKAPVLSRLGSKAWSITKKKVQEAVWKVAQHLLTLYARRKIITGTAFTRPDALFHELEESFPYDETAGQAKAITEVLSDLTGEQCMDRLVCGDVGFGKTEVAIRAAFKVTVDGYQVAILVPTTVLAEQHAATFKERLQGFPVTIDCLNRFRTNAEQKQILKNLAEGRIDIIIGTHRILSKDVAFKRLGLLIIDEEHRFGVSHKERLKLLRSGIDVLTLTATPIPRTLQMSLLGVRDLSVINTPPVNRQSVKTFIAKYSDLVIKESIIRELQRGGQVFLVHNRVHSIHELAFKVQKLVPEAKIAVAHGQMAGKILEEIMVSFVRREVNVLICTTIIESGLDIPNANTIIINRADRMGLAEIYQLRGRVGRSKEQAYAYLLVPSLELLSKDAKQRLRALMDYNELGGGFKLALSDLQIRGGGNILGESQSGTIAAVGYDLYLDLLQRTVEDLKRQGELGDGSPSESSEIDPEINLKISAFIPEEYIPDLDQRYIAYRRIASVSSDEEAQDLQDEFTDRYGHLPPTTLNLFGVVTLKLELKKLKISKLEEAPDALVFSFVNNTPASPERILLYVEHHKKKARLTPDSRLVVRIPTASTESIFGTVRKILHSLG